MTARRRLAVLVPPSEGKAPLGGGRPWDPASGPFGRALGDRRRAVAEALAAIGGGDAKLLGVRGPELDRAQLVNRHLLGAPTRPAWRRFTGVVWDHLDVASLDRATRARARSSILVVTALTGVSALTDPIPDFRLKLSVRLGDLGRLDRWWRDDLSAALNRRLRGRLVIDLLPDEHAAAWEPTPDRYDLRRVRLVDQNGRVAGHTGKAAKGRLVRALLEADPDDPRSVDRVLRRFEHAGVRAEVTIPAT
ncbi:MAG: peroxide stress protein YaaA [Acidimicrobiales bacterium]